MANPLASEKVWFGKYQCEDAEKAYQERLSGVAPNASGNAQDRQCGKQRNNVVKTKPPSSDLVNQIAKARQQIQKSLDNPVDTAAAPATSGPVKSRLAKLEQENKDLRKVTQDLQAMMKKLESRIGSLEGSGAPQEKKDAEKAAVSEDDDEDDDDDIDLFGSDDEADAEAEKLKEERIKQYQEKKSAKKVIIAKSSIILDVKTWGDEVDLKEMEELVRSIEMDGLKWGQGKILPVAFGVKKLQIICIIEDDKVSTEDLQEKIETFEDHVQSTDIVAFNKI